MNSDELYTLKSMVLDNYEQYHDGYKTFSVRIREDVVQRIDEISAQTGRSRNELIGILLEFSLDRCSIEPK